MLLMRGRITRTWFRWSSVASTDEIAGSFTGFVSLFIPLAFPLELLQNVTQFLFFFWRMWAGLCLQLDLLRTEVLRTLLCHAAGTNGTPLCQDRFCLTGGVGEVLGDETKQNDFLQLKASTCNECMLMHWKALPNLFPHAPCFG